MVMAGNENVSGPTPNEPLSARLQWLQQRRDALQEKLLLKNAELTNLCIEEAELTGVLPPEIPLEPGQTPPSFRKSVATAHPYPQNLINKLKNNEAEESSLELERHVQIGIAEAALAVLNDPTESKPVRRKQRLVYQQSQRRLQELDARLNFIRQSHGKTRRATQIPQMTTYATQPHPQAHAKHRGKKPRATHDSTASDRSSKSTRSLLQEGGISLSPLGPENNYNTYPGPGYQEADRAQVPVTKVYNQNHALHSTPSPVTRRPSPKLLEHDHNDNHNIYILPDQHRARTYSHGSGGSRNANHYFETERNYRPVPNTYTEQERLIRYRQLQQQQQQQHHHHQQHLHNHQQYPEYRNYEDVKPHASVPHLYYEAEPHARRYVDTPDYQPPYQSQQSLQRREANNRTSRCNGPPSDPHQPPGYWIRYEDEIIWCPDDQTGDKFSSLDRRKRYATQSGISAGTETQPSRYHTVAGSKSTSLLPRHQVHAIPQPQEQPPTSRMLLRTQSLGSVETWNSGNSIHSHDSQDYPKDTTDDAGRKGKEKGWYETSLDSGPGPSAPVLASHATSNPHRSLTAIPSLSKKVVNGVPPSRMVENQIVAGHARDTLVDERPHARYHQPPKLLEIPAESKPLDNGNESPNNCTIVQPGKYQPYREVTKPFEMSDFYKYSTKYRKRTENLRTNSPPTGTNVASKLPQDPRIHMMVQMSQELQLGNEERGLASPVQKRIYQPSRRMTCQPCNPSRTEDNSEEWYAADKEAAASATLV